MIRIVPVNNLPHVDGDDTVIVSYIDAESGELRLSKIHKSMIFGGVPKLPWRRVGA